MILFLSTEHKYKKEGISTKKLSLLEQPVTIYMEEFSQLLIELRESSPLQEMPSLDKLAGDLELIQHSKTGKQTSKEGNIYSQASIGFISISASRFLLKSCLGTCLWWAIICKPSKFFPSQSCFVHSVSHNNRTYSNMKGRSEKGCI